MTLTPLQEQWLQALESGEYKQCKGWLFKDDAYCCLGVAEIVCGRTFTFCGLDIKDKYRKLYHEKLVMLGEDFERLGLNTATGYLGHSSEPFYAELQKAGYTGDPQYSLASYNDAGVTFKQLAQAIRAYPEAVFKPTNTEL